MRILIVEDEYPTAEDIKYILCDLLREKITSIKIETTLGDALFHMDEKPVDLLFLDLNLNGKDGFDILTKAVASSFHTIIVSANYNRAIEAYEYGVLDFIAKPYTVERFQKALDRLDCESNYINNNLKYLTIKEYNKIKTIPVEQIKYFKGANVYVELHLDDNTRKICNKTLNSLSRILPKKYIRIHKSFIVNKERIQSLVISGGGRYDIELLTGELLPVGRQCYKELKARLNIPD